MLDERSFATAVAGLCEVDADLAAIVERHGVPEFWAREPGFPTLVLLILEQQVSLASAKAAYDRLVLRLGGLTPQGVLESSDEELRADGFSRQKNRYARALATAIEGGTLDLDALAELDDVGVRTALVALPGIGPWTSRGLSPLRPASPRHVADRRHRVAGGGEAHEEARRPPDARGAGDDRRGLAAAPRNGRAAALAPLSQRWARLGSKRPRNPGGRAWHSRS